MAVGNFYRPALATNVPHSGLARGQGAAPDLRSFEWERNLCLREREGRGKDSGHLAKCYFVSRKKSASVFHAAEASRARLPLPESAVFPSIWPELRSLNWPSWHLVFRG